MIFHKYCKHVASRHYGYVYVYLKSLMLKMPYRINHMHVVFRLYAYGYVLLEVMVDQILYCMYHKTILFSLV